MRKNSNIRKVFYEDLLSKPKTINQQKYQDAFDYLFPLKTSFQEFLSSTSDEQVEVTKYLIDLISFLNINSPPTFLHRKILALQKEQQSQLNKKSRYSRDHVKHIIYLYFTGILLYSKTVIFNSRIDKELKDKKRQFSVHSDKNSYAIFSELWSQFSIYHDIGYPIEELGEEDLKEYILEHVVGAYQNYSVGLRSKYAITLVSNLISILALIKERDDLNFQQRIYQYIDKDCNKIIDSFSPEEINKLLGSYSYSNVSSDFGVKLLSTFIDAKNIFVIVEDNETAKILNVITYDHFASSAVKKTWAKSPSSSIRYFIYGNIRDILKNNVRKLLGEDAMVDLDALAEEVIASGRFKDIYTNNAEICNNLNSLAFVTLIQKDYISADDFFSSKEMKDPFLRAHEAYIRLAPSIIDEFSAGLKASLNNQVQAGKINLQDVLRNPDTEITKELIFECFHFEQLANKISEFVNKKATNKTQFQMKIPEASDIIRQWISNEETFRSVNESFGHELLPKIRRDIAVNESLHKLLYNFELKLDTLFSQTLSRSSLVTAFIEYDFKTSPLQVLTLYDKLKETSLVKEQVIEDVEEYIERVRDYSPEWKNDHGFISALYYLATVEFNYQLLRVIQENQSADSELLNLLFFTKDNKNIDCRIREIKFQASICFPAIFYHNYYPKYAQENKYREYKNNFHRSPFTYIAALADSLQNWGRESSYNPGIANLSDIRPENYYDIDFKESRMILYVNSKYISEEGIIKLRNGLKEYLQDIDAILEVRSCEFSQSFIA